MVGVTPSPQEQPLYVAWGTELQLMSRSAERTTFVLAPAREGGPEAIREYQRIFERNKQTIRMT